MATELIPPPGGAAHVELIDVGKRLTTPSGTYEAVRNISLEIARGEIAALVGHSGCGKTTLVNLIAGLQRPTSDELRPSGQPFLGPGPDCAMVLQNFSLLA